MDEQDDRGARVGRGRSGRDARNLLRGGLGCLLLVLAANPAGASPIRSRHDHRPTHAQPIRATRAQPGLGAAWSRFLAAGPTHWSTARPPGIPSGLHLVTTGGQLVETPFVDYLFWRRSLNPARFDHYHPVVGPELGLLLPPPTNPTPVPVGLTISGPPPFNPQPEIGTPEPAALPMALTLIAVGVWYRRRVGRPA